MIEIKGISFNVEIEKKKIRNIYLRVKDKTIYASCPYYVANYEVYNFIETKRDWIYKAYQYSLIKNERSHIYRGGDTFYYFGDEYKLVKNIGKKNFSFIGDSIYFTYKDNSEDSIKALYKYMDKYLLIKANDYLDMYLPLLKDYGYNLVPELSARVMSSKWGCCFTRNNKIHISSYLIHYPLDCLQYIILHEITHFIIPNHSDRFYQIIQNNMPNYKEANKKLR